jgi:cytochrome c peroxidase
VDRHAPAEKEVVTRIYVNMGKAIAAYERYLIPGASRFDKRRRTDTCTQRQTPPRPFHVWLL